MYNQDGMTNKLQLLAHSKYTITLLSGLARLLPVAWGHWLADRIAKSIASHPASTMVRAIRANQWVIHGCSKDKVALDQAVAATLQSSARALYHLYHYKITSANLDHLVDFKDDSQALFKRPEFDARGLMLVAMHIGDWDMVLRVMIVKGLRPFMLTIPDPQGSQKMEFEWRRRTGMNVVPASVGAFRQAIRYLQQGGVVMTGIDRPIPDPKLRPMFFNRPADLPAHHVYLALKARVPIQVIVTTRMPDGRNQIRTSHLIEMESHPDAGKELEMNVNKVLSVGEEFIRRSPHQWTVALPVWPGAMDEMP
jgi:lauroyl/myristoyl acyltransferase